VTETIELETLGITRTYAKKTACRNLYDEEPLKKIDYIKIYGEARSNDCGCSYLESMADLLTALIKRCDLKKKSEARLIVKALRDHRCNKQHLVNPKDRTSSCADAVGRILQEEFNITNDELRGR
jgi:hypothetical protein